MFALELVKENVVAKGRDFKPEIWKFVALMFRCKIGYLEFNSPINSTLFLPAIVA